MKVEDNGTELRNSIFENIEDLVSDFLYYDRKEDGELPRGKIEEALENGVITVDEIADSFREQLKKGL